MSTAEKLRKEITDYLSRADERFLQVIYSMIQYDKDDGFTEKEKQLLDQRKKDHLSGKSASYSREEAKKKMHELLD